MEVLIRSHRRRVKKPVTQDLYWWDDVAKQMWHGKGGRLEFNYNREYKRSIPKVVPHEDWVHESSYNDILKWIESNSDRFNISIVGRAPNHYVLIDINANDFDDLTDELHSKGFLYDYDTSDLKEKQWQH